MYKKVQISLLLFRKKNYAYQVLLKVIMLIYIYLQLSLHFYFINVT